MGHYMAIGGEYQSRKAKITTTDITTIVAAGEAHALVHLYVTNLTTNTPALTIAIFDGTDRYYLRYQLAMSAKERVEFEDCELDKKDSVEVTIGSDSVDVVAIIEAKGP